MSSVARPSSPALNLNLLHIPSGFHLFTLIRTPELPKSIGSPRHGFLLPSLLSLIHSLNVSVWCAVGTLVRFAFYWKVLQRPADYRARERGQPEGSLLLSGFPLHWAAEWDHLHLLFALHHPTVREQHLQHFQGRKAPHAFQEETSNSGQILSLFLTTLYVPQQCSTNRRRRSTGTTAVPESITKLSVLTVAIRATTETRRSPVFLSLVLFSFLLLWTNMKRRLY